MKQPNHLKGASLRGVYLSRVWTTTVQLRELRDYLAEEAGRPSPLGRACYHFLPAIESAIKTLYHQGK